ncbi:MAG: hypothetical protein V4497_01450 [Bacteroidota bacterium]
MEIDDLKSDWNTVKPILRNDENFLSMLQENKHPVLKGIRKQIVIELMGWIFFSLAYYSMFDGTEKPFWVNLILLLTLALPIVHSFYGYYYNKYLADGLNIKEGLEQLYHRLKKYAFITIIARVGLVSGLLLFFCYNIHFTTTKYFLLAFIIVIIAIQMFLLYKVWNKRLRVLQRIINDFRA